MIGIGFFSFLVLLVISGVVAAVLHYGLRYRFLDTVDAVIAKIALGWFGAWLGSPVFRHWWFRFENVYIVSAVLGSLTLVMLNVVSCEALYKVFTGRPSIEKGCTWHPQGRITSPEQRPDYGPAGAFVNWSIERVGTIGLRKLVLVTIIVVAAPVGVTGLWCNEQSAFNHDRRKFHALEIRPKSNGLTIRARKGYYAPTALGPSGPNESDG